MGNVLLVGDFNSRLGPQNNCTNIEIPHMDHILPPVSKITPSIQIRSSCDPTQNQYGKKKTQLLLRPGKKTNFLKKKLEGL